MKTHRIIAILIRHLYLYHRSVPRLMDIFFWPITELLVWGFLSRYLEGAGLGGVNIVTVLLGALIFWDLLSQSQRAVSVVFLEDVWERNLLNIFVTPLRVSEFLISTVLIGLVRIILVGVVVTIIALSLYQFNIFQFGLALVPFVVNLLLFGWAMGLFSTAIILRLGTNAQVLAFGLTFLLQPFSAVFYPVSALPEWARAVSYLLPSTHVFEGMRQVIATGAFPWQNLGLAFGTNGVVTLLVLWFFYSMFANVKEQGRLMKLD
mgnify:CR=1 FL=1